MIAISQLSSTDSSLAYPVARLRNPTLTLDEWRRYVRRQLRPRYSGILAARSARLVIFGITPWWIRPDLECETILWAGPMIVVEPGAASPVHEALLTALTGLATEHGCRSVNVVHPGDQPGSPLPHLDLTWYGAVLQRKIIATAEAA